MTSTDARIDEIVDACRDHGDRDIVVLSGVPATGKTHMSRLAAEKVAGHPAFVRRAQFHPGFAYEDFMEGLRPKPEGGYHVVPGIFLDWNSKAAQDPANNYVLLIEEFSRADLPSVLGELMTFIEHRDEAFTLPVSQEIVSIADNLTVLATMNPRDRSALEIDEAMLRRLRIVDCPPDMDQLQELMLTTLVGSDQDKQQLIAAASKVFTECAAKFPDLYESEMPFGHGIFAGVRGEDDLNALWHQRIKRILFRAQGLSHPFAEVIKDTYLWV